MAINSLSLYTLVLYIACYDFDKDFECLTRFFFWIFVVPYKSSLICDNKMSLYMGETGMDGCILSIMKLVNQG